MFAVRQREGTSVVTPPPAWNATVNSSNATSTALPPVEGRVTVSAQSQHHRTRPALTFTPAYPVRDAAYACNVALLELRVGGLMSESGDANALLGDQWRRVVVVADTAKIDLWMHPPAIGALLQALHGVVAAHHLHVTLTGTGHTIDMLEAVNEPCAFVVRMNATESATAPVTADAVLDVGGCVI